MELDDECLWHAPGQQVESHCVAKQLHVAAEQSGGKLQGPGGHVVHML